MSTLNKLQGQTTKPSYSLGFLAATLLQLFLAKQVDGQMNLAPNSQLHVNTNASIYTPGVSIDNGMIHGKGTVVNYDGNWITNSPVMNDADSIHVHFNGNTQQTIGGTQGTNFYNLTANNPQWVIMANTILSDTRVRNQLSVLQNILNLNGKHIDLWSTWSVQETDTSGVFDNTNNGTIRAQANLNAPVSANPGNLRFSITSIENLGQVTVIRGHMDQLSGLGSFLSFEITTSNAPANDIAISMQYQPYETYLGMGNDTDYRVYEKANNVYSEIPGTSNPWNNTVDATVVWWFKQQYTISTFQVPLGIGLDYFSSECQNGITILNRRTLSENDSNHFVIQRSTDGVNWQEVGIVPAAGNSNQPLLYSFEDAGTSDQTVYYRLVEVDNDGIQSPQNMIASNCIQEWVSSLLAFPNPTTGPITIQIQSNNYKKVPMYIYDMTGKLVKTQEMQLVQWTVQYNLNLSDLAAGTYAVHVDGKITRIQIIH